MNKTGFDSVNKIWYGSKSPSIYNSNVSVGYLVLNVLQNTPGAVTQISADTGIELTCRQMYQKTINIASYLQGLGYKHGDVAGFVASNSGNLAPIVFACLTIGLPINGLPLIWSEKDMEFSYSNTKPKIIFCDSDVISKVDAVVKELQIDCLMCTVDEKVEGIKFIGEEVSNDYDTETFRIPHFNMDSVAFILSTSGTSDNPKLVCKTHKDIVEVLTMQWKSKFATQEIWFVNTGIYWITGVFVLLMGTLYGGKRIITTRPFEPNVMLQLVSKYNVTSTLIIPPMLAKLLNCESEEPQLSMKLMLITGTPVSTLMCEKAKVLFPNCLITPSYGTTEAGFLSMNLSNENYESVGELYRNVEMKILDEKGYSLGPGEVGEIVYKLPGMFQGYLNDPKKTAETIKNGWSHSGDLGFFDDNGLLFISDRKTFIFKLEVNNASPTEFESIINGICGVDESCVAAVYQMDLGLDLIFAFVVKKPGSELTEKFIEEYVTERVAYDKQIKGGVHFVDSIPMTASGKLRRGEVTNWAKDKYKEMNL